LNLQFATTSIFYSRGYIGNIGRDQAEGRTCREGQTKPTLYIDIVMQESVDEILFATLKERAQSIKVMLKYIQDAQKSKKVKATVARPCSES